MPDRELEVFVLTPTDFVCGSNKGFKEVVRWYARLQPGDADCMTCGRVFDTIPPELLVAVLGISNEGVMCGGLCPACIAAPDRDNKIMHAVSCGLMGTEQGHG